MNYWGAGKFAFSGELEAAQRMLADKENAVFFDVGANNGEYALEIAKRLPASATIYCFEPLESMFHELSRRTRDIPNVRAANFGLSDKDEKVKLYYGESLEVLSSLYSNVPDHHTPDSVEIEVKSLDGFLESEGIDRITYLKIDVEGHELKVLEGAKNALSEGRVDNIQFEFGEGMLESRVFFRDFWEMLSPQFTIYRILSNGLREIGAYSRNLEIFHCVNFLAVRKHVADKPSKN